MVSRRVALRHVRPQSSLPFPTLHLGFIGDSITGGDAATDIGVNDAVTLCGVQLSTTGGTRTVTTVNQGVAGTVSHDWIPSFGTDYSTAVAAFASAGVTLVHIMLGTNDAKTSNVDFLGVPGTISFYLSNLTQTVNALVTAGYKVVISYPLYLDYTNGGAAAWSAESDTVLSGFQGSINSLVDGVHVFQGDVTAYTYFSSHTSDLVDGVHPDDSGHAYLGAHWATAIATALGL